MSHSFEYVKAEVIRLHRDVKSGRLAGSVMIDYLLPLLGISKVELQKKSLKALGVSAESLTYEETINFVFFLSDTKKEYLERKERKERAEKAAELELQREKLEVVQTTQEQECSEPEVESGVTLEEETSATCCDEIDEEIVEAIDSKSVTPVQEKEDTEVLMKVEFPMEEVKILEEVEPPDKRLLESCREPSEWLNFQTLSLNNSVVRQERRDHVDVGSSLRLEMEFFKEPPDKWTIRPRLELLRRSESGVSYSSDEEASPPIEHIFDSMFPFHVEGPDWAKSILPLGSFGAQLKCVEESNYWKVRRDSGRRPPKIIEEDDPTRLSVEEEKGKPTFVKVYKSMDPSLVRKPDKEPSIGLIIPSWMDGVDDKPEGVI